MSRRKYSLLVIPIMIISILFLLFWISKPEIRTPEKFLSDFYIGESPSEQSKMIFSVVEDAMKNGYTYLKHKKELYGIDFDELTTYYRALVNSEDDSEIILFYTDEMLSVFNDRHTRLTHHQLECMKSLPFTLRRNNINELFVSTIHHLWETGMKKIKPGMILKEVDGEAIDQIVQSLKNKCGYQFVRTDEVFINNIFMLYYFYSVRGCEEEISEFVFEDSEGNEIRMKTPYYPFRSFTGDYYFEGVKQSKQGLEIFKYEEYSICYIDINSFLPKDYDEDFIVQINQALDFAGDCDHYILDIRSNPGGDFITLGREILSYFMKPTEQKWIAETEITLVEKRLLCLKDFKNSEYLHVFGREGKHYPGWKPENEAFEFVEFGSLPISVGRKELDRKKMYNENKKESGKNESTTNVF